MELVENLIRDFKIVNEIDDFSLHSIFIDDLLSSDEKEVIDLHYYFIKKATNKNFYLRIRNSFLKRKNAESLLLGFLSNENNSKVQADILHLLGRLRSEKAIDISKQFLEKNDEILKDVALYVIGWVGGRSEIIILNKHMIYEAKQELRITAASAHRQIMYRLPNLKEDLLKSLKLAFTSEKNKEVLAWIIIMIENIAVKRLGILEDKDDPDKWSGDIEKAILKTEKFLSAVSFPPSDR